MMQKNCASSLLFGESFFSLLSQELLNQNWKWPHTHSHHATRRRNIAMRAGKAHPIQPASIECMCTRKALCNGHLVDKLV